MQFSEILNLVLGGGFVGLLITVVTLRATVRKANAEAEKANAEAETVRIDNAERASRVLVADIVNPLREELKTTRDGFAETKKELNDTRKELGSTKREMARLRKALDAVNRCEYNYQCPVRDELREFSKRSKGEDGAVGEDRPPPTRAGADERDADGDAGRYDGAAPNATVG